MLVYAAGFAMAFCFAGLSALALCKLFGPDYIGDFNTDCTPGAGRCTFTKTAKWQVTYGGTGSPAVAEATNSGTKEEGLTCWPWFGGAEFYDASPTTAAFEQPTRAGTVIYSGGR
jgi:hypothetical protein